jgi:hypothetical protein
MWDAVFPMQLRTSYEMVGIWQWTGVKREDTVGSRYQTTTSEDVADGEDLAYVTVIC